MSLSPVNRSSQPTDRLGSDLGRLVLRCTVAGLILLHGISKITGGIGPVMELLRARDLPGMLGYAVFVGEVLAPLLVIAGVWTRAAALLIVLNMLVAIGLAHTADIARLGATGGWAIELQALYLLGAVSIALLGAGSISAAGSHGRFN